MPNLLLNAKKEVHSLVTNKTLRLATSKISGNSLFIQGYHIRLPVLSSVLEDQVQTQIKTPPGENGLAGVLEKRFILSSVLYMFCLLFQHTIVMMKGNLLDNKNKCVLF